MCHAFYSYGISRRTLECVFGHKMICDGKPMDKSALCASQTSLATSPISEVWKTLLGNSNQEPGIESVVPTLPNALHMTSSGRIMPKMRFMKVRHCCTNVCISRTTFEWVHLEVQGLPVGIKFSSWWSDETNHALCSCYVEALSVVVWLGSIAVGTQLPTYAPLPYLYYNSYSEGVQRFVGPGASRGKKRTWKITTSQLPSIIQMNS